MKAKKKTASVRELIDIVGELEGNRISENAIRAFILRAGMKCCGKKGRYRITDFIEARKKQKEEQVAGGVGGQNTGRNTVASTMSKAKLKKLSVEIQMLETKRDQLRGELLLRDDVLREYLRHVSIVKSVFSQFQSEVAALTRNKKLLSDEIERLSDSALNIMREKIGEV